MRRVVVTGLGIVSSIGNNANEVLASCVKPSPAWSPRRTMRSCGFRCQVTPPPRSTGKRWSIAARRASWRPALAYAHIAMEQAIADSGLEETEVSNERTGLIVGSGGPVDQGHRRGRGHDEEKGPKRIGPFAVPKAMSSGPSAVLSTWFKIRGINYSISSACATSAHCIGAGAEQIQLGKQDIVFAGGCEELDWTLSNLFDAMGAMSSNFNDRPAVASRAYDKDRDGFVIAGGAGIVVLEEYEHAKARGAKIYGEVVGYAANSDGYDMVAPSGEGAARCMKLAMAEAGGRTIDYLNPHGTSTPVGDSKEMGAVRDVFGDKAPLISSTKSLTGHSLGAAGAQEAIYSILMLNNGFAAESANIENLDPEFADLPILRSARTSRWRR
jgi:3-oxoacyl-[acyl-carrier-protein] synthase-1